MSTGEVEEAAAALLAKLDASSPSARALLAAADDGDLLAAPSSATEDLELQALTLAVQDLETQIAAEEMAIAQCERDAERAAETLAGAKAQRDDAEATLQQHRRVESRQRASAKLLQLQLTVATQLYGVAESLSHVAAAPGNGGRTGGTRSSAGAKGGYSSKGSSGTGAGDGGGGWVPDALRHRDREVEELRRALKRQRQLVADAHRQLLELSTRKQPLGAAATTNDDVHALRAALAEQEMLKLMAEARSDELQAQVRLFEEQGLRLRLHPPVESDSPHAPPPITPAAGELVGGGY